MLGLASALSGPGRLGWPATSSWRQVIQAKLELEWSPEQIAAWGRGAYPKRTEWHVCHEAIYQALYHGGRGGLSRQLTTPGCARGGRCASDADHPTSAHPGSWCPPH